MPTWECFLFTIVIERPEGLRFIHARIQGGPRGPWPPPSPQNIAPPNSEARAKRALAPPPGGQEGLAPPPYKILDPPMLYICIDLPSLDICRPIISRVCHFHSRPVARGGVGGVVRPPPQLPIPKILFHPLAILFHLSAILFHPLAILFHPSAILFHPLAILFHPSAILFHPLAILFHPSAILFHPWNMWMTSHGQCPRGGGACECPRVKLMTSRGQCPRGGCL